MTTGIAGSNFTTTGEIITAMESGYHHDLKTPDKVFTVTILFVWSRLCALILSKLQRHPVNDSLRKLTGRAKQRPAAPRRRRRRRRDRWMAMRRPGIIQKVTDMLFCCSTIAGRVMTFIGTWWVYSSFSTARPTYFLPFWRPLRLQG
jgi:hypothetical protein